MYGDVASLLDTPPGSPRPRFAVAHAWLSAQTYDLLERAALARQQHPDRLAAQIIKSVLDGAESGGFIDI
jgi:hypothetical protein